MVRAGGGAGRDTPELLHQGLVLGELLERPLKSYKLRESSPSCRDVGLGQPLGGEASSQEEELDAE